MAITFTNSPRNDWCLFRFVVTNWSDNNQRKRESVILIENLISEIETNQKRLENVIGYHTMLRDSSRFYSDIKSEIKRPNFFEGTRVLKLTNSAYNTGIQTGVINELSIEKIQAINQLYTFQNDYNEFGNIMMASLINKDFSDDEEDVRKIARFLAVTMTDIVIMENYLMEGYKSIKSKLEL